MIMQTLLLADRWATNLRSSCQRAHGYSLSFGKRFINSSIRGHSLIPVIGIDVSQYLYTVYFLLHTPSNLYFSPCLTTNADSSSTWKNKQHSDGAALSDTEQCKRSSCILITTPILLPQANPHCSGKTMQLLVRLRRVVQGHGAANTNKKGALSHVHEAATRVTAFTRQEIRDWHSNIIKSINLRRILQGIVHNGA